MKPNFSSRDVDEDDGQADHSNELSIAATITASIPLPPSTLPNCVNRLSIEFKVSIGRIIVARVSDASLPATE